MSKKILVLLGHPDADTFTGSVADHYQAGAEDGGHEVRRINLGDLQFDPILHKGYKEIQNLEPDLSEVQESITWADHVVIVYPNWWCTMPALLKGLFDRIWLPGFAFNFNKETQKVEKHLQGKSARVFIIAGTHSPFATWWKYGDYTNEIQHGILGFAGFNTSVSALGPTSKATDKSKERWFKMITKLGQRGG
jgi:putative NADPH-quinone reductase